MKPDNFLQNVIAWLFTALFFWVPLFFTPLNSELFEFNKIILVYSFTALITGAWTARMILQKKLIFKRSFLDIPLVLFLISQFSSTLLSIDPHTSIFGYYSRFNGGLLSTISYLLMYWAFVANCDIKDVKKIVKFSLISAILISIYGILEHFGHSFSCLMFGTGFNVECWVQKVQERVFATLGQPNWLAAYLTILIPVSIANSLNPAKKSGITQLLNYLIIFIFYLCLLFTQSRSGFLGFVLSFAVFWVILFIINHHQIKSIIRPFLILNSIFLILVVVFGSPFSQINKYLYYKSYFSPNQTNTQQLVPITSLDGGISESGDIRKIVWKGAWRVFKHYPVFGSGVETFAYSYYNFRPIEHNLVSEWDFLYNKAHNEYLNYLSTTGIFGLGTYLLFICSFLYINLKSIFNFKFLISKQIPNPKSQLGQLEIRSIRNLSLALFSGWMSLLVTNFFGFSVVVTSLYFYLIPAFTIVLSKPEDQSVHKSLSPGTYHLTPYLIIPVFFAFYILHFTLNLWRADFFYNQGQKLSKTGQSYESYQKLHQAVKISPNEPIFLSEISVAAGNLALIADQQNQASSSSELTQLAINYSDKSLKISPANLNLYKTQVKLFYTLSTIKPEYLNKTIEAITQAIVLSPTDPKLIYNLGLLYGKAGQGELAIKTIEKSVEMKPNYFEARNTLAIFYEDIGENQKAVEQLKFLIKMSPENKETLENKIKQLEQ